VAQLQGVSSSDRRRFWSGRACLDFVHTGGEGDLAKWELLHGPRDVERWLGVVLDGAEVRARPGDVNPARELRHAVTLLAFAAVRGEAAPAAAVEIVNAAARRPPLVPQLGASAPRGTVSEALSTLARDAIDLFGGPLAGRVRVCAADNCGLFFVDASRPGKRRWCSMERCGNRAKVRAYRAR
jgi:predicted RNA-binding Zn ribbon-like protein